AAAGRSQFLEEIVIGRTAAHLHVLIVDNEMSRLLALHHLARAGVGGLAMYGDEIFAGSVGVDEGAAILRHRLRRRHGGLDAAGTGDLDGVGAVLEIDAALAAHADTETEIAVSRQTARVRLDPYTALSVLLLRQPQNHLTPETRVHSLLIGIDDPTMRRIAGEGQDAAGAVNLGDQDWFALVGHGQHRFLQTLLRLA